MADADSSIDVATVIAISVVIYSATNLLHEGLGHGGASILLHLQPRALTAIYFDGAPGPDWAERVRAAGGSVANLLACVALWPLVRRGVGSASTRFALWLAFALNFLMPAGYLLFSGLGNVGDWARVVGGWPAPWAWRIGEAAVGGLLYFWVAPKLLAPPLDPLLGRGEDRLRRAKLLMLIPYLAGGITFVVAGLLNPVGMKLVLISALAASFGGTSLLAWYWQTFRTSRETTPAVAMGLPRSTGWLASGAIALIVFVVVFGPGFGLSPLRWPAR